LEAHGLALEAHGLALEAHGLALEAHGLALEAQGLAAGDDDDGVSVALCPQLTSTPPTLKSARMINNLESCIRMGFSTL
jgi:hypothetical protein